MHRTAATAWVLGGGLATYGMGAAIAKEMQEFPGGAKALELSVMPAARAFRPMRWPAERLDTLGGYITFHNMLLITFFLTIYGAVQGSKAVRGMEERGGLDCLLATGVQRRNLVMQRVVGFALIALTIAVGFTAGLAMVLSANGQPDVRGSFITCFAGAVSALTGYAFGLAVSQFTMRARVAAGICGLALTVLQVVTNLWDQLGPVGLLRFVSPFHYANASRALVPGHGLDVGAMLSSLALAALLVTIAAVVFERRDYGSGALPHRTHHVRPMTGLARSVLRTLTGSQIARARVGLLAWSLGSAVYAGAMLWLQPSVMDVWEKMSFLGSLTGGTGAQAERMYQAFIGEIISPVIAGYVVTMSAAWLADRSEGRVEAVLSLPVTCRRLVTSRLASSLLGTVFIVVTSAAVMQIAAVRMGVHLDGGGVLRLMLMLVLFGAAIAGVALVVITVVPSGLAVVTMSLYLGASYLLTLFVPMLGWPGWLNRLSIFWALGRPYLDWPTSAGLSVLLVLAVGGTVLAVLAQERRPAVS